MNYTLKSSLKSRWFSCFFVFLLLSVANKEICAQEEHSSSAEEKLEITEDNDSNIKKDLFQFFFYVQESYFAGHQMYCENLENVICYGKRISPGYYNWVLENKKRFKIECDGYSVSVCLDKDTIISLYKDVEELRNYVNTDIGLWRLVNIFDKNDVVIEDTSIYTTFSSLRQNVLVEFYERNGYEMEKKFVAESERLVMLILIFDHGELRLHPLSNVPKHPIDSEYLHQLEQLATSVCQEFNVSKMLFTVPMMYRE